MYGGNVENQFETSVIRKNNAGKRANNAALRSGNYTTSKKYGGGKNSMHSGAGAGAHNLDNETADFKHVRVTTEFKKALQQARVGKKMSQKDLANRLNVKQSVINDYECGKAIPNGQLINKMNRVLGCTLPRIKKKKKSKDDEY